MTFAKVKKCTDEMLQRILAGSRSQLDDKNIMVRSAAAARIRTVQDEITRRQSNPKG